jgi:molecular chaperone GrpE
MENKKHKIQNGKKHGEAAGPGETECECDERNECSCEEVKMEHAAPAKNDADPHPASGHPKHHAAGDSRPASGQKAAPDYYAQLLGLKADFENYRKRVEKERPELIKFGKAEILLELLPLYDLLMQAHLHVAKLQEGAAEEAGQTQDIVKGLEMIFREFTKVFEAEGIRPMEVVGRPYDPMASEIIGTEEGTEENDGLVTAEFQKGFYYGDKVLRPARVRIAKAKAAPAAEAPAEEKNGG